MFAWLKKHFGRGSKVDQLIRALPNPDEMRDRLESWRDALASSLEKLRSAGNRFEDWSAEESVLLDALRGGADVLDGAGHYFGASGEEKRAALISQLRRTASVIGMVDVAFDTWWNAIGRPVLDDYIARLRSRQGEP